MKKIVLAFFLVCLFSCGDYIDRPKNLLTKEQMAEILADLSINNQVAYMYTNSNLEAGTRFILKNHKVKKDDFIESFRYYVVKNKMNEIVDEAQKIILKKDPKAEKYVNDRRLKSNISPIGK
ncbi:DUF4296 domain-containing protein [Chryseobacterium fistulae]|uniref:DUF4296 domain-containing protein n=1 Tax=Chryseobacterium fistulae TaxID=2675058 RepID=A0A6N4XR87_9FLAO|nr:DUF4296 domain-containing protein [Chryseobacterium fistulae]CAA7385920.1 hypothetical protein CHRY9393_00209 [Chryseobacterium fistulae]